MLGVYSAYLIVVRERRWDVPVEMGLGEEALCKNVQKLRPPPRQRGVGRRMAPQSGDLNPTVSIGEVSSCHAALMLPRLKSRHCPRFSHNVLNCPVGGTLKDRNRRLKGRSPDVAGVQSVWVAHAPPPRGPKSTLTDLYVHAPNTRARRASAPRPWRPWRPCPPT